MPDSRVAPVMIMTSNIVLKGQFCTRRRARRCAAVAILENENGFQLQVYNELFAVPHHQKHLLIESSTAITIRLFSDSSKP